MRRPVTAFAILLAATLGVAAGTPARAGESVLDRLLRTAGETPARAAIVAPAYDVRCGELRAADRRARVRRNQRDVSRFSPLPAAGELGSAAMQVSFDPAPPAPHQP